MPIEEVEKTTVVRDSNPDQTASGTVVHRKLIDKDVTSRRNKTTAIIYYVLDVVEILLAIRLIFRLLGANPSAGIVNFLYAISAPFVAPFVGIFKQPVVAGSVLEWSTVVAMILYALVVYLIVQIIRISTQKTV